MTWHNYKSGLLQNMMHEHLKQYDNSHAITYIHIMAWKIIIYSDQIFFNSFMYRMDIKTKKYFPGNIANIYHNNCVIRLALKLYIMSLVYTPLFMRVRDLSISWLLTQILHNIMQYGKTYHTHLYNFCNCLVREPTKCLISILNRIVDDHRNPE